MAPRPPDIRRAPAEPWRSSGVPGVRGPEMAPRPPDIRRAPAEPWRSSGVPGVRGPERPPDPQIFVAPRPSRGAPLGCLAYGAPRWPPDPPDIRRAPAEPWRSLECLAYGAPRWPPDPQIFVAPRRSRGAPRSRCSCLAAPQRSRDAPRYPDRLLPLGRPASSRELASPPREGDEKRALAGIEEVVGAVDNGDGRGRSGRRQRGQPRTGTVRVVASGDDEQADR